MDLINYGEMDMKILLNSEERKKFDELKDIGLLEELIIIDLIKNKSYIIYADKNGIYEPYRWKMHEIAKNKERSSNY